MTTALKSCGGCGLFLHHTPDCRWHNGWKAVYMRYGRREENACDSLDEALRFLITGEDYGDLSSVAILDPAGVAVRSRDADGSAFDWRWADGSEQAAE